MNNFRRDLAYSHSVDEEPCWVEAYQNAFPDLVAMANHRRDGKPQRSGVDRSITLASSKQVLIDQKACRIKETGDIMLEYISVDTNSSPGWVEKPLIADYIAYAFIPSGRCYLLPVPQLQATWRSHKAEWLNRYGTRRARNEGYNTLNCPVPVSVLYSSIGSMLRVSFTPPVAVKPG